ncbi:histidine kinase [Kribbella sp. NPDC051952]|uniref:sensor histidine kinase n=1 Tax=Kribbella sp. NPDC051952 TaxID=3154851 RepID=UPI00341D2D7D
MSDHLLSRRQLILADCVAGLVYGVLLVLSTPSDVARWSVAVTAALAVSIAVRRLWPRPVFAAALAISVVALALDVLRDPLLAASCALYLVALTRESRRAVTTRRLLSAAAVVASVVLMVSVVGGSPNLRGALIISGAAALYGAWMLGVVVRDRRAAAARAATALAEQAVAAERLRIARDLHDIVAHSMGLIAVKAGVANHVLRVRPEEVSDALSVIESTSRDALVELRHMLGLLRTSNEPADLAPPAGLAALPDLVARVESTGVRVELVVEVTPLPEAVGLTVHRIVQECLTNVTKHARARTCRIAVVGDAHAVQVEVTDDGVGGSFAEGHGLIGIRERVGMYDGSFQAGPRSGGGFEVVVRLPYQRVGV